MVENLDNIINNNKHENYKKPYTVIVCYSLYRS